MFQDSITAEFIESFVTLNGERADVHIEHILYGTQKIKRCVLHTLWDGERIGLIVNEEEKYITTNELCGACFNGKNCCIQSDVMKISILR